VDDVGAQLLLAAMSTVKSQGVDPAIAMTGRSSASAHATAPSRALSPPTLSSLFPPAG
jgi:hypothetical protein